MMEAIEGVMTIEKATMQIIIAEQARHPETTLTSEMTIFPSIGLMQTDLMGTCQRTEGGTTIVHPPLL